MQRKRDRASRSEIEARRSSVERFWIKGIPPSEIAKRLHVSDQTIYRDLEELETSISIEVRRSKLKPVKLAFLELREIKRLLWDIFEKENRKHGNNIYAELAVIDRLFKIMKEENRLACLYLREDLEPDIPSETSKEEFAQKYEEVMSRVSKDIT